MLDTSDIPLHGGNITHLDIGCFHSIAAEQRNLRS